MLTQEENDKVGHSRFRLKATVCNTECTSRQSQYLSVLSHVLMTKYPPAVGTSRLKALQLNSYQASKICVQLPRNIHSKVGLSLR